MAFEGARDFTIPRGFMAQWQRYTSAPYRHVTLPAGDHYFVSTHFREVSSSRIAFCTPRAPTACHRPKVAVAQRQSLLGPPASTLSQASPGCCPPLATSLQVTREVGQECLKLQEQMRGGQLGAGHSWVAAPAADSAAGSSSAGAGTSAAAAAAIPAAEAAAAGQQSPAQQQHAAAPGLLYRLADRLYNAVEDVQDALSEEVVQVNASGSSLLYSGTAALAAAFILRRYFSSQ